MTDGVKLPCAVRASRNSRDAGGISARREGSGSIHTTAAAGQPRPEFSENPMPLEHALSACRPSEKPMADVNNVAQPERAVVTNVPNVENQDRQL